MTGEGAEPKPGTRLDIDVENTMAMVAKAQQLGGHFPSEEALARARRVLVGDITVDEAKREMLEAHGLL